MLETWLLPYLEEMVPPGAEVDTAWVEGGVEEVCTDAACVGPDLGKEGHQGDEVSPLTITDPCNDSPQSTQEELWATG